MSDQDTRRKRLADNQGSRECDDRDSEEFVTEPQIAPAEVLAQRRIVTVKKTVGAASAAPSAPPQTLPAAAAGSPFGSVLGSFGAATAKVAPSPFASFGTTAPATSAASSPFAGFGGTTAAPPTASAAAPQGFSFGFGQAASTPAPAAPAAPAASAAAPQGFSFGFGQPASVTTAPAPAAPAAPAASAAAPQGFSFGQAASVSTAPAAASGAKFSFSNNFDFSQAGNAFANAKLAAAPAGGADDGEDGDDPEAEVPITSNNAAPTLAAADVKTGEENDVTEVEASAKLFELSKADKQWHERGVGQIKINKSIHNDGKPHAARVVMRDSKTKKGLLNCLLDTSFVIAQRQEKHFTFSAPKEDATVATYLVKVSGTKAVDDTKQFLHIADTYLKKPAS